MASLEKYYRAQVASHVGDDSDASRDYLQKLPGTDNTNEWRHIRMREPIAPLLAEKGRWLTIGDGNYGSDGAWLASKGQSVLCTDIHDGSLRVGKELGLISEYLAANGEALPFTDGDFDWVFCKEAYHHMPRPPVAFYEMLRVARKGIVLIEPAPRQARNLRGSLAAALLDAVRPPRVSAEFEPSGNYLFRLSISDVRRMMMGIGLRYFAYKSLNDFYVPGVEFEMSPGPLKSLCERKIRRRDRLCRILGIHGGLMVYIVFKEPPPTFANLKAAGFQIVELPKNPYID